MSRPILLALALCLLPVVLHAASADFGGFSAEIVLNHWDVSETQEEEWEWLDDNAASDAVVDPVADAVAAGTEEIWFFSTRVRNQSNATSLSQASLTTPGNSELVLQSDEDGEYLFVSTAYDSLSDLEDAYPSGDYDLDVEFANGTTQTGTISVSDYSAQDLDLPAVSVAYDDGVPDSLTMAWDDADADQWYVAVLTATDNYLQPQDVESADNDIGSETSIEYPFSSTVFDDAKVYLLTGGLDNEYESGVSFQVRRMVAFDNTGDEDASSNATSTSSSSSDDETATTQGCVYAPRGGADAAWLLLLAAPALAALRRRTRRIRTGGRA
jgi:hypothetical protein